MRVTTHSMLLISVCAALIPACAAFYVPAARYTITKPKCRQSSRGVALNAERDNDNAIDSALKSLPSPEVMMENVVEGKIGERGEQYVIAQFSLFLFIAIGNIPFGDIIFTVIGPLLILAGLFVVYKSAADLKDNLSPWPVPTDPESGRGSLVNSGIYSYVRHPMYTGVLLGMAGLSVITDSVMRLLLTCGLYYVLDVKSDYEEERLNEAYGIEYDKYKQQVQGKFFPADLKRLFD